MFAMFFLTISAKRRGEITLFFNDRATIQEVNYTINPNECVEENIIIDYKLDTLDKYLREHLPYFHKYPCSKKYSD